MPQTSKPSNPFNNVTPNMLTERNYVDPFIVAQKMEAQGGLPQSVFDQVHVHCAELAQDNFAGFLDMYQMNIPFETDYIQFVETNSPDYVIDDEDAISRNGNDFTIDWTAVQGYEAGEDAFFYRKDFTIRVVDDKGVVENGVITSIDKANNTFTAVCRNGLDWTVTSGMTLSVIGGDFDKGSCSPEGLLELRKKKTHGLKLITIKDSIEAVGGEKFAFCIDGEEIMWYDENNIFLRKRFNKMISETLMLDIESIDGSGAHLAGKHGTKGLFQNLNQNSYVNTGYITTIADLDAIVEYYDSLGYAGQKKEFTVHCDNTQFRHLEKLAPLLAQSLNVQLQMVVGNTPDNFMRIGFKSLAIGDYTFHFSKWGLTDGNSSFSKNRLKDSIPKGIIMPMGKVKTMIDGQERNVPYIFKAYQDKAKMGKGGMIRTYFTGGFNGDGDCEYAKTSKSTTVGLAVVCPEAIVLIR